MSFRSAIIHVFFLVGLLGLLACSPRHPVIPFGSTPDTPKDPEIVYGVLANGFQYILKQNHIPDDRTFIHLNVFSGSMHEQDDQQGVAHYLEHMLFNGSEHFKPGELVDYFHSIGMDFGADANASTSFYNTIYDLALPTSDQEQLDKAFLIIQDYAKGALLLESEVERERGVILAEKRERDSVSTRTFKKTLAFELEGSLINDRFPIGIVEVLEKADRQLLKSYYDRWYRPDNMALVVVGDLDIEMAEKMIRERFAGLEARTFSPPDHASVKWKEHEGIKAFYHHEPEASTTNIAIQVVSYTPFVPETISLLRKKVLLQMVNSMLQNRISRQINEQTADFTKASAWSGIFLRYIDAAGIYAESGPDKWEESLVQIEQFLRQVLEHGFNQNELDRVKSEFISSLEQAVNLSSSQKSSRLARQILTTINNRRLLLSDQQRLDILKPFIGSITLEKADHAFRTAWDRDHRLITVTGNARIASEMPDQQILSVYEKSLRQPTVAYERFESRPFPYLKLPGAIGAIRSKDRKARDLGIQILEFENNVRLLLKQTDFKKNEFSINVCLGQGKRSEPPHKPGLSILAERVLQESGFGGIDIDQLAEALAGKEASASISIKNNHIAITGTGNPRDASVLFELIRHYILDPGFRQTALNRVKIRYQQEYERLLRTPDGMMQIKGNRFLAEGDERFGLPSPDVIGQYTITDIQDWLLPVFHSAPIEISIVGDIDPQQMTDLTAQYLGGMKNRQAFPQPLIETGDVSFPAGERIELQIDTQLDSALIHAAFQTDDFWDIMKTRHMSVLSRVFSDRLRKTVREELGQSYSPYVYNRASTLYDDYGVMHAVVQVKPGNHPLVIEKIDEILESFRADGISEQETQNALKPVLTHLRSLRQTNGYWLNSVMADSSKFPAKYDWARHIISGYQSIGSRELTRLARTYLTKGGKAVVIITPKL